MKQFSAIWCSENYSVTEWDEWSWRQTNVTVLSADDGETAKFTITPEGKDITYSVGSAKVVAWLSGD